MFYKPPTVLSAMKKMKFDDKNNNSETSQSKENLALQHLAEVR